MQRIQASAQKGVEEGAVLGDSRANHAAIMFTRRQERNSEALTGWLGASATGPNVRCLSMRRMKQTDTAADKCFTVWPLTSSPRLKSCLSRSSNAFASA